MKELISNYDDIIYNLVKNARGTVDIFDIIAAIFVAAFLTIGALGFSWIAYSIIISLSSGKIFCTGLECIEWLKIKENRSYALVYLNTFLKSNFAEEIKNISKESVSIIHSSVKDKLIDIFDKKMDNFDKFIMNGEKIDK